MVDFVKIKDAYLKQGFNPSSTELNNLCVSVHVNPLLEECVVDGRIVSDLEYALQSNNIDMLRTLSNNIRNVRYGDSLSRHLSAEDLQNMVTRIDEKLSELSSTPSTERAAPIVSEQADTQSVTDSQPQNIQS